MYHVDRGGWAEVEGVIVAVCMVIGDEGCKGVIDVLLKMVIGLYKGWGRTWSWQAFWRAGRHTVIDVHADGRSEVGGVLRDLGGW